MLCVCVCVSAGAGHVGTGASHVGPAGQWTVLSEVPALGESPYGQVMIMMRTLLDCGSLFSHISCKQP